MSNLGKILVCGGVGALAWYGWKIYTVIKNIEVNFSSLQVHKIDKDGIQFTVGIEFDNTNGRTSFTMQRLKLRLYLDGSKVAEVDDNNRLLIDAYGTYRKEYRVSIGWGEMRSSALAVIRNFNEKISVGVKGVIYVNNIAVTIGDDKITQFNLNNELKNLKGEVSDFIENAGGIVNDIKDIFSVFKKKNIEEKVTGIGRMNVQ